VNLSDILPTVADLAGVKLPAGYEIDGESLVPFLFTGKPEHREWIYSYQGPSQLIRGKHVMKDGRNKWWDVAGNPEDLISYQEIKEWGAVSEVHRDERERLLKILPGYDLHEREHDAPGVTSGVIPVEKRKKVTE
jgi:arylsulfatase A-like enzyme